MKKICFITIVCMLLLSQCTTYFCINIKNVDFVYDTACFPSCHASTLVENCNGELVAAWYGGSYERHPDVSIYVATFSDNQWSKPRLVADGVQCDSLRYPCWNPVLAALPDSTIILFYKVGPSPQTWQGMYKISEDGGYTWSQAVSLPSGFLGPIKNKPLIIDDNIICGSSVETLDEQWTVHVEIADITLSHWTRIEIDCDTLQAIQPTFIQIEPDTIMMLCRTRNCCIAQAWSTDRGHTFSKLQATSVPNNNSGFDAITLSNGRQLMVCNPVSETDYTKGRNRLDLMFLDFDHQWQTMMTLEDEEVGEFSYPAIIQTKDGLIHITYTYNREKIKHLVLTTECQD